MPQASSPAPAPTAPLASRFRAPLFGLLPFCRANALWLSALSARSAQPMAARAAAIARAACHPARGCAREPPF
eukprot:365658-Chlamydomonas_euryale.AAC.6